MDELTTLLENVEISHLFSNFFMLLSLLKTILFLLLYFIEINMCWKLTWRWINRRYFNLPLNWLRWFELAELIVRWINRRWIEELPLLWLHCLGSTYTHLDNSEYTDADSHAYAWISIYKSTTMTRFYLLRQELLGPQNYMND